MVFPAGNWMAATAAVVKVLVVTAAGVCFFRRRGTSVAEAFVYAVVSTLMVFSFLFQAAFLLGLGAAAPVMEAFLAGGAAAFLVFYAGSSPGVFPALEFAFSRHRFACCLLCFTGAFLSFKAMALPSGVNQWPFLWPVLDLEKHGRIGQGVFWNHRILSHLVLRHHTQWGLGLFGFLSYGAVGAGTYALARRHAWPQTALTTVLVVMSAPRMVFQAVTPGIEMVQAAAVVFTLVALFRSVEQPGAMDLMLLFLGIAFSISDPPMGYGTAAVLLALSTLVLYRRHGGRVWWQIAAGNWKWAAFVAVPVGLFSQLWVSVPPDAPPGRHTPNPDGIIGCVGNSFRYFLENLRVPEAVDRWLLSNIGLSPNALVERLFNAALSPFLGEKGAAASFGPSWPQGIEAAWFGPLAMLLVFPAFIYALRSGPRRLKATAVAMAAHAYLACLIPAWRPGSGHLFMVAFAGTGFMSAYFLAPWRLTPGRRHVIEAMCAGLMAYGCVRLGIGGLFGRP